MKVASPLRYPGGKSSMTSLLGGIRMLNGLGSSAVAEPFAGGAGASLSLLFREDTYEIHINDADSAIHDFWWTLVNRPRAFLAKLSTTPVNMTEWRSQRDMYRRTRRVSRLQRGFAAFYLNRCNRSGIIMNGGPIGGVKQTGKWKLGARFNRAELLLRCSKIAEYGQRIQVSQRDALDFIANTDRGRTFYFIDPPYYEKGETLYLNTLNHEYHESLAKLLRTMKSAAWVLTYDDCPQIRALYAPWANVKSLSLRYSASERRRGREVLITPKWMRLPDHQLSAAIEW